MRRGCSPAKPPYRNGSLYRLTTFIIMLNFFLVFIGGGLGSALRYAIGLGLQKVPLQLPVATLVSNVSACLVFALIFNSMRSEQLGQGANFLLLIGFCGGLSTFSTFGYESYLLLKQQNYAWLLANILLSLV